MWIMTWSKSSSRACHSPVATPQPMIMIFGDLKSKTSLRERSTSNLAAFSLALKNPLLKRRYRLSSHFTNGLQGRGLSPLMKNHRVQLNLTETGGAGQQLFVTRIFEENYLHVKPTLFHASDNG